MTNQKLTQKDFITLADYSRDDLISILREAELIRAAEAIPDTEKARHSQTSVKVVEVIGDSEQNYEVRGADYESCLKRKAVSMLFSLPSTRTRAAVEWAIVRNGGYPLYFTSAGSQLSRGESVEDTIKCLERYSAAVIIRTDEHEFLTRAAAATDLPVINVLSNNGHPAEALSQFLTLNYLKSGIADNKAGSSPWEISFDTLSKLKCAYIGDGSNVASSLAFGAAKLRIQLAIASPKGYQCPVAVQEALAGTTVQFTEDPREAVRGADAIFGDTYVSMGQENEKEKRDKVFRNYQVNEELVREADSNYCYLHCLPAYRGREVTAGVIDGKNSHVFDIVDSRLLIYRALLALLTREG